MSLFTEYKVVDPLLSREEKLVKGELSSRSSSVLLKCQSIKAYLQASDIGARVYASSTLDGAVVSIFLTGGRLFSYNSISLGDFNFDDFASLQYKDVAHAVRSTIESNGPVPSYPVEKSIGVDGGLDSGTSMISASGLSLSASLDAYANDSSTSVGVRIHVSSTNKRRFVMVFLTGRPSNESDAYKSILLGTFDARDFAMLGSGANAKNAIYSLINK